MTTLRKNEFMDMLEMNNLLFEDKDKFIHCDIPTLGKVTYYPKSDKLQINRINKWEEGGFQFIKNILLECTIENPVQQATSLVKVREVKSDEELRDDFAGLAMQSLIIKHGSDSDFIIHKVKESYEIADAMMKQRKLKTE